MNPDLATYLTGLTCLALGIVGTIWCYRPALAVERANADKRAREHTEVSADNARLRTMLASAEADVEWARTVLARAQGDADIATTALRGLLENQARADVLHPDEPVGRVIAFERIDRRTRTGQ